MAKTFNEHKNLEKFTDLKHVYITGWLQCSIYKVHYKFANFNHVIR